jgi:hypothetical protein
MPKREEPCIAEKELGPQRDESGPVQSLTDLIDVLQRESFCRRFTALASERFACRDARPSPRD